MIRCANPGDRSALGAMLARSFGKGEPDWFLRQFPHLFSDAAIGQHSLSLEDGSILGCVGCYPFAATLHGVPLRLAGIGQVATVPEARGRGLMTGLLEAALRSVGDADLFWLYGDRQRYGRIGFAPGGTRIDALTWDRYALPVPAGPAIRALDPARDDALIERMLALRPLALRMDAAARLAMLAGKGACGWTDGESAVLLDGGGRTVWAVCGGDEAVARLVAHQVARRQAAHAQDHAVRIQADPGDLAMLRLIRLVAGSSTIVPSCMLRVGRLQALLTAWAASHPPVPGARLRASVLDGGIAGRVRIACDGIRYVITASTDEPDLTLEGVALAEVVFGLVPPALSGLPHDSALRHLLPLGFNIPECYGL
jgi:predicted N-acetyltransferase YhbS